MEGQKLDLSEIRKDVAWITRFLSGGQRHWGIWHPEEGWRQNMMGVFVTTSKAIAEAEADTVRRWKTDDWDPSLWEVRCIEEWADEQSG